MVMKVCRDALALKEILNKFALICCIMTLDTRCFAQLAFAADCILPVRKFRIDLIQSRNEFHTERKAAFDSHTVPCWMNLHKAPSTDAP